MMVFFYAAGFAVIGRLFIYIGQNRPPISFRGRLATGRWILPGLRPGVRGAALHIADGCDRAGSGDLVGPAYRIITYPLATAAVLIVALNMGPPLKRWRLTGHHRISPWGGNDPNRVQL